jgi:hypothetical protein
MAIRAKDISLTDILAIIERSHNLQWSWSGKALVIRNKAAAKKAAKDSIKKVEKVPAKEKQAKWLGQKWSAKLNKRLSIIYK